MFRESDHSPGWSLAEEAHRIALLGTGAAKGLGSAALPASLRVDSGSGGGGGGLSAGPGEASRGVRPPPPNTAGKGAFRTLFGSLRDGVGGSADASDPSSAWLAVNTI